METFPLNNLAEKFEVDRSVMVKAMCNVPPDLVRKGKLGPRTAIERGPLISSSRTSGDNTNMTVSCQKRSCGNVT
jgi:hypothetical protein